jgi:flagellar protein FliO/FliZ
MTSNLLQLTLALLVVVACILAAAWLLQTVRRAHVGRRTPIHIEASVSLGSRERAVLVEVAGQWLLLGVAPGRVSTLAELKQAPLPPTGEPAAAGARSWLQTYLEKFHAH